MSGAGARQAVGHPTMQSSLSFFAHQTAALQFWSCPTSVLIFRDPTPPKSAGEPVQQAQAHPTSLKIRMPGAKVQHHPANLGFSKSSRTSFSARYSRAVQHPGVSSTFRRLKSDVFSGSHVVKSQCFFQVSVYLKEGEKLSLWNLRNRSF